MILVICFTRLKLRGIFLFLFITSRFYYTVLIGSGLNRAILTAQIAPALTKSYQQKMREWEIMQKSQFLG